MSKVAKPAIVWKPPTREQIMVQIQCVVKRIVKGFNPDQIILFGSQARGDAGPDSDVDLLIVMPMTGSRRERCLDIMGVLHDFAIPIDIMVTTADDYIKRKDVVGTIEWPASKEGMVLYART
jgi:predicted nucleotidyltransferase